MIITKEFYLVDRVRDVVTDFPMQSAHDSVDTAYRYANRIINSADMVRVEIWDCPGPLGDLFAGATLLHTFN